MTTVRLLIASLLPGVSGGVREHSAATFRALPQDGFPTLSLFDGKIQEAEIPHRWRERTLRKHDLNENHVIDESELTVLLETVRSWTQMPKS